MLLQKLVLVLMGPLMYDVVASPVLQAAIKKRHIPATHVLHERHTPMWSTQWTKRHKLSSNTRLPMRIGLKQSNLDAGHDLLTEISTPGSPKYGQHMTSDEVVEFFAPHQSSVDAVVNWLVASGITVDRIGQSANKQWIQFDARAGEVEDLLFADFFVWEHASGSEDVSTEEYHIPAHIQEHIDYITPGTRLRTQAARGRNVELMKEKRNKLSKPRPNARLVDDFPQPNSTTCSTYITAECTRAQYGIENGTTSAPGNELGIFESLDDHYSRADLDTFFSTLYPYIPNGTYPEERLVDGAVGAVEDPSDIPIWEVGLESSLDFDAAWPLIWPQKTVLFQEDDEYYEQSGNFVGFWNTFLDAVDGSYCTYTAFNETGDCTTPDCVDPAYPDPNEGGYKGQLQCGVYKPTNVISISYGYVEAGLPDNYLKRQCSEWMKLTLQGTTIVISSGDDGVGNPFFCPEINDDGAIFAPDFVASCPYVLSVGSTELNRPDDSAPPVPYEKLDEIATTRFASGGGFSNVFGIPDYQRTAVNGYFAQVESTLPFKPYHHFVPNGNFSTVTGGLYHHGGRAYPDVGAVGDRQLVYAAGDWWLVGGTSLSAPVWAAVLTLVNEQRIASGKSTIGFINPILYAHPEVFNDIVIGSNPGCFSDGFPTATGWDPVTGLGSPNFPKLLDLLMAL